LLGKLINLTEKEGVRRLEKAKENHQSSITNFGYQSYHIQKTKNRAESNDKIGLLLL
jgi:hypothetical protein